MNNGLQIFSYEDFNVEVITLNDEVLFNARQVGEVLDIKEITSTIRDYELGYEKVKVTNKMIENSDMREMQFRKLNNAGEIFLTESGLYKLSFRSNKESSKEFTKWVTREVLPQIRQTGNYISDRDRLLIDLHSNDAMVVANAHRKLVELETKPLIETIETQNNTIETQNETIETQKPNVEFATKIQDNNEELYDMGSVCRILKLKIGRNALFLYLRTEKVLMSSGTNKNIPYQSYMDRGYFKVTLDMVNGNPFKVTKMTGKGLRWLNDKMNLGIDIDKELELENEVTDNLIDELEKEVMW